MTLGISPWGAFADAVGLPVSTLSLLLNPTKINRVLGQWKQPHGSGSLRYSKGMTILERVVQKELWQYVPVLI